MFKNNDETIASLNRLVNEKPKTLSDTVAEESLLLWHERQKNNRLTTHDQAIASQEVERWLRRCKR
jgi:hypothetical protein